MTFTKSATAFILVPGAFHRPAYLDGITASLRNKGYETSTVPLPTLGGGHVCNSFQPDVEAIYAMTRNIVVNQKRDAIVVAHSYGGVAATEAVGRLAHELSELDEPRGKIRLVFVAAYVLLKGQTVASVGMEPYEDQSPPPTPMNAEFSVSAPFFSLSSATTMY